MRALRYIDIVTELRTFQFNLQMWSVFLPPLHVLQKAIRFTARPEETMAVNQDDDSIPGAPLVNLKG